MNMAATVLNGKAGPETSIPMSVALPDPEMMVTIANERLKVGDVPNALAMLQGAIDVQADCFNAYTNLTSAAASAAHFEVALSCAMRALALKPNDKAALSNAGINLWRLNRHNEALDLLLRAHAIDPDAPGINHNLGLVYYTIGNPLAAIEHLEQCLRVTPDNAQAKSDLALATLKAGRLHDGFVLHEGRWGTFIAKSPVWDCGVPMWAGEDLDGKKARGYLSAPKKIVLHHEQGFGDTIQFIRFLPELIKRYPNATVRVLVPGALLSLMQASFAHLGPSIFSNLDKPGDIVRAMTGAHYHCPLLSMVRVMGTEFGTLPKATPYLRAPSSPGARKALNTPGTKVSVGIVWAASPGQLWSRIRSVPITKALRLAEVPGVRLYSLQVGPFAEDLHKSGSNLLISDLVPTINDFADTAAYMQQLDLIISVDSAAAHLAGALGRPVWMFNPFTPCWRWCKGSEPWYPTMHLFNQDKPNDDWAGPIDHMKDLLTHMVGDRLHSVSKMATVE